MNHPVQGLDDLVHQRTRLGILTVVAESAGATFAFLQEALNLTDGNLSRHVQTLEAAGLVRVEKGSEDGRRRTWVHITKDGRKALKAEIDLLKELVRRVDALEAPKAKPVRVRRAAPTA